MVEAGAPDHIRAAYVMGSVGKEAAIQYLAYLDVYKDLPRASAILSGKLTKFSDTETMDVRYLLCGAIAAEIVRDKEKSDYYVAGGKVAAKYVKRATNFLNFLKGSEMGADLSTNTVMLAMQQGIDFGMTGNAWREWLEEHQDAISGGF